MCKKWDGTERLKMPVKSGLGDQTVLQEIPNGNPVIMNIFIGTLSTLP